MKQDTTQAALVRHYDRLAERYDRRWRAYLTQTLGHVLEALGLTVDQAYRFVAKPWYGMACVVAQKTVGGAA